MDYFERTIKEERKYTGNFINVDKLTVLLPNGREATRDVVRHPGAAVVVPIQDNGNILLVKQYRKPCDMVSLEIPAGKLDKGEDPAACAERELAEETGYHARNLHKVMTIHSTPGFSDEVLHMYMATGLTKSKACPDDDEFITCGEYSLSDCINMVDSGEITDAKTIMGIFLADRIMRGEYKTS
jgi:ADP-ribose pyrophosphatase